MDSLLFLLGVVGLVVFAAPIFIWAILSSRIRRLQSQVAWDAASREEDRELLASLTRRVHVLEKSNAAGTVLAPKLVDKVEIMPAVSTHTIAEAAMGDVTETIETPPPLARPEPEPVAGPPIPELKPNSLAIAEEPLTAEAMVVEHSVVEQVAADETVSETWRDRLRKNMGGQEWEAVVGGNWLNKVGVLVLVIGVALLLGYEFTRVGPLGRVAIGMGVGLTMLFGGVGLERRQSYAIFARGLIGGGWAAIYFTTYAMYGVAAAKVIESPYLATTLLLSVAAGMILHSLRYKSQAASGLAYFIAFATLALSESTPFSVLALLPLAGSLLFLAYRFDWYRMAVFGLFATYATVASRPDSGASLSTTQALFGSYWLLFEAFDLLRLKRRRTIFAVESLIFPLNALGFLALSLVKWHRTAAPHLHLALAAGAALYLISALLRVRLRPPSSFAEHETTSDRMAGGGYEGSVTITAALAAAAIIRGTTGMWMNLGLLFEGEVLFLAAVQFRETYLRQLAGSVFVGFVAKLFVLDRPSDDTVKFAGGQWLAWSPVAALAAVVFYVNRMLRVAEGVIYSSVAAALFTLLLGYETPGQYLGVPWVVFGAMLFEFGFIKLRTDFRYQGYVVGILGTAAGLVVNVLGSDTAWRWQWLPLAICAIVHYTVAMQVQLAGPERLATAETRPLSWAASASAVVFLSTVVWKLGPADYAGVGWLVLGAVLFELGLRNLPTEFRQLSYFVSALGLSNVTLVHVIGAHKGSLPSEAGSLLIAALTSYFLTARVFRPMPERIGDRERSLVRDAFAVTGTLFVLTLAWLKLPAPTVALAWAVIGMVLLEIGFAFSLPNFRMLGNVVAACTCGRLFLANFTDLGDTVHISHRLLTVGPIIVSQYYAWSRYRKADIGGWESSLVRAYLYAPAVLAVALARFELGRTLAVVAWAVFGLGLYRLGLVRNLIDLRWQSYAIAALAFWRAWNTNLYISDSLAGVHGRIFTGAIVIASLYCAQLLSPRDQPQQSVGAGILDRYSRAFYSLLASVLLAVLLFYEVSGGMLTMAWGIEALTLLGAGFPLRDRFQRLSGLFLFLVCVLKLFLYDLRQLEIVNRILSFIVLGVILVAVSWMYTRFRDRIQRYL